MTIRCATFDLDDTLWAIYPVIRRAEDHFLEWMKEHQPRIAESHTTESLFQHRHEYFQGFPELHHDFTVLRLNWMTHLAQQYGYSTERISEGFDVFWKQRNIVDLFDHTHETLQQLSGSYTVGAITNGNADIHHIGIGHYFDFFLKSSEVGFSKPHPDIFERAIRQSGCAPEEMVHIGDDPVTDIQGACEAGMKTIWVNVLGREYQGDAKPDATVTCLSDLPATIEHLAAGAATP